MKLDPQWIHIVEESKLNKRKIQIINLKPNRKCKITFLSSKTMNMKTGYENGTFNFGVFSKMFGRNDALKNDVRTHTIERPFECKHCQARFKTRDQLSNL